MAQIDHHDLVAETVHLDKVAIGQRTHDKVQMCGTYMRTPDRNASGTSESGPPTADVLYSFRDEIIKRRGADRRPPSGFTKNLRLQGEF